MRDSLDDSIWERAGASPEETRLILKEKAAKYLSNAKVCAIYAKQAPTSGVGWILGVALFAVSLATGAFLWRKAAQEAEL
ncbi:MAG: hypothetical protein ACOX4B_01105 [Bacillota bacterium]